MKIDQLQASAARNDRQVAKVTSLSRETLATVVGGGGDVPPEICAIHFYYPADALA